MEVTSSQAGQTQAPKKNIKLLVGFVAVALIAAVAVIAVVFLDINNRTLLSDLESQKDELASVEEKNDTLEKELIYYKNTDLVKELEIVNLKLKDVSEELDRTKSTLSLTEGSLSSLRASTSKISKITNLVSLMFESVAGIPGQCFTESYKSKVSQGLNSYGDSNWTQKWNSFIADTDPQNCSWSPTEFQKVLDYGLNRIEESVK